MSVTLARDRTPSPHRVPKHCRSAPGPAERAALGRTRTRQRGALELSTRENAAPLAIRPRQDSVLAHDFAGRRDDTGREPTDLIERGKAGRGTEYRAPAPHFGAPTKAAEPARTGWVGKLTAHHPRYPESPA